MNVGMITRTISSGAKVLVKSCPEVAKKSTEFAKKKCKGSTAYDWVQAMKEANKKDFVKECIENIIEIGIWLL